MHIYIRVEEIMMIVLSCVLHCITECIHSGTLPRYVMSDLDINKNGRRYRRSEINRSVLHVHE